MHSPDRSSSASLWKRISLKGVLLGALTDIGCSNLWVAILVFYFVQTHAISLEQLKEQGLTEFLLGKPGLFIFDLSIGTTFSVLGGYVSAIVAKRHELLNGVAASWLAVALGIWSIVAAISHLPVSVQLVLIVVTPFSYLLGGYIRRRQVVARSATPLHGLQSGTEQPIVNSTINARRMFGHLTDFHYKRNWKQAIGFYIAYVCLGFLMIPLIVGILLFLTNESSTVAGYQAGIGATFIITFVTNALVLKNKRLYKKFGMLVLALVSITLALFVGMLIAMIPVAFLTTRESVPEATERAAEATQEAPSASTEEHKK